MVYKVVKLKLYYCPKCKERSAVRKAYTTGGQDKVVQYCINQGCKAVSCWLLPTIAQFKP